MHPALKTADVRSRIEPELKDRATEVLAECGLKLSDAIRLFLRQVVIQQGLPFEVKTPNATTMDAMTAARSLENPRFASPEELMDDLKKTGAGQTRKPSQKK